MSQNAKQPDASPSHVYRPLTSKSGFRLMVLLPSPNFDARLECRLEHAIIGSCKPYEALSYVWGEPVFNKEIILDDQKFMVTAKLQSALRYLRLLQNERTLWVDAVCINQQDFGERREQVGRMREIYGNCIADIMWLAEKNDKYVRGMDIIKRLEGFQLDKIESLGWRETSRSKRPFIDSTDSLDGLETHSTTLPRAWVLSFGHCFALSELLDKDMIWRRVWIKQEIVCAPKVILVCGKDTLNWSLVEAILHSGRNFTDAFHLPRNHQMPSWTKILGQAQLVTDQRKALRGGSESTLLDVLARFRGAISTDPRDKIYGLLGLASDTCGVEADYERSVQETYIAVTLALINSLSNLDIICQNPWQRSAARSEQRLDGLPGWVPDFGRSDPMAVEFLFAQRGIYAPGRPTCSVPCVIEQPGTIVLNGFRVGSLKAAKGDTIHSLESDSYRSTDERRLQMWLKDWIQENLKTQASDDAERPVYRTGENQMQAFWRTLTGDCKGYPTERLTPEDIAHDQSIVQDIVKQEDTTKCVDQLRCWSIFQKLMRGYWRFFISDTSLFVLAQAGALAGDVIAVLDGAKTPLLLRQGGKDLMGNVLYQSIGGAYVHGFMNGEVLNSGKEFKEQMFRVI